MARDAHARVQTSWQHARQIWGP